MKKIFLLQIIIIFFVTGCGFKVVNQNLVRNFDIAELEAKGNKRVNYYIKNKLLLNAKSSEKKLIKVILNTKLKKIIKEKNIGNEVTKYQLMISSNVKFNLFGEEKMSEFSITDSGDFSVGDIHSKTVNNEKKLIRVMSENLGDRIVNQLITKLNDL